LQQLQKCKVICHEALHNSFEKIFGFLAKFAKKFLSRSDSSFVEKRVLLPLPVSRKPVSRKIQITAAGNPVFYSALRGNIPS
jgi:hypothetical protein